jgi:membrane-associated phospholipid phosphatase
MPTRPDIRFGLRAGGLAIGTTAGAALFCLLVLAVEARWTPVLRIDRTAAADLHTYAARERAFVAVMKAFSLVGTSLAYWIIFVPLVVWLLVRRRQRLAIFVTVTVLGGSFVNTLVKVLVHRARPILPDPVSLANGLSFPSGHANGAVVAYSVLLTVLLPLTRSGARRLLIGVAVVMVVGIGFSRVALGVHFVSDVLAGYALGAIWVVAMATVFRTWKRERQQEDISSRSNLVGQTKSEIRNTDNTEAT